MPLNALLLLCGSGYRFVKSPRLDTIVVSAQLHRLKAVTKDSGYTKEMSVPTEAAHLYSIRPGRAIKRLTGGKADDLAPQYSKSMNGLLFVRRSYNPQTNELMFLPTGSSTPKRLGKLPSGGPDGSAISASGQTYVVKLYEGHRRNDDNTNVVCVHQGEVVKSFGDARFFQIVPGTEVVYVQKNGSGNLLFDCASGQLTKAWSVKHEIWWISSQKALSLDDDFETNHQGDKLENRLPDVDVYGRDGQQIGKIRRTGFIDEQMHTFQLLPQADARRLGTLIVEADTHMSSGIWPRCWRMNLQSGVMHRLFDGKWLDTNDRGEFLALQYEWIGAYHEDNDRTGHLFRASPNGSHERQLTHYPYDVSSACWAPTPQN